jgi:hypothetical protein
LRFKNLFHSKHKKSQTDQGVGWDVFVEAIGGKLIFIDLKKRLISRGAHTKARLTFFNNHSKADIIKRFMQEKR